jgi:hypothetical protein
MKQMNFTLGLGSIPKLSHYVYGNILNPKESQNGEGLSQAFQVRNTQPVLPRTLGGVLRQ